MNELATRAATGAVYVALTLGAAWAGPVTTALLFLPVTLLAAREMQRLLTPKEQAVDATGAMVSAALVYAAMVASALFPGLPPAFPAAAIVAVVLGGVVMLLRRPVAPPHQAMGALLTTVFLVALPFGLIPSLMSGGPWLFIGFMLLLWTNDTGAYLVGRAIGRTGLLRRVSPKKTVEGLVGGISLAMAAGAALARFRPELDMAGWMVCALVVSVAATLGDLLESALKREAGVKDSGRLLPGHGGILDRFDGFLLAMPAMVVAVEWMR